MSINVAQGVYEKVLLDGGAPTCTYTQARGVWGHAPTGSFLVPMHWVAKPVVNVLVLTGWWSFCMISVAACVTDKLASKYTGIRSRGVGEL